MLKKISFLLSLVAVSFGVFAQESLDIKIKKHQSFSSAFSYDGSLLASGGENELVLWDMKKNSIFHQISMGEGGVVLATAFSPDGYFVVAACQDGIVRIYTVEKGLLDRKMTAHDVATTSLSFSPDGKYLVVGSADGVASVWDMWRNMKVGELRGHTGPVSGVDFSPKGDVIATCSYDGSMKLWKVQDETYSQVFEVKYGKKNSNRLRSVKFDPDGKKIAVASDDAIIRVFDVENRNVSLFLRGHTKEIYTLEYSSDGRVLFSGSFDGSFRAWNVETGDVLLNVNKSLVYCLAINHKGDRLVVSEGDANSGTIRVINTSGLGIVAPPLINIFAHADQDEDYHKPKQIMMVFSKEKPKLSLKQPILPLDAEPIRTTEPTIRIKGSVVSENQMHHFSVNGFEIPIIPDSAENFSYDVKLAYGNNTIHIKAIDIFENETEMVFKVQRYIYFEGKTDHFDSGRKGKDYALVICTDTYQNSSWNNLKNPVNDGEAIKKKLTEMYGFEVDILKNPTRSEIYLKLREYNKRVFSDDDQLLIFFAGHGTYDEVFEEGYIVATDSKANDEIMESYISHSNLKTMINNIPCDHTFLMLDVCFGGTFDSRIAENTTTKNRGADFNNVSFKPISLEDEREDFIKSKLGKVARLFLSSGGKTYVPDDNGFGHSPFCTKFLEALEAKGGKDGILTFLELYSIMEVAKPIPVQGKFGKNEFGSDFLFISK